MATLRALRNTSLSCLVLLAVGCRSAAETVPFRSNFNTELAEQERDADALRASLTDLLATVGRDDSESPHLAPELPRQHAFFYKALRSACRRSRDESLPPVVLKSYSPDGASYLVTLAFFRSVGNAPQIDKILELHARRDGDRFRFGSPFAHHDSLPAHRGDGVTFHSREFDAARAAEFTRFKTEFERGLNTTPRHLDYYCYDSLDSLLKAHGILYDCTKCNDLAQDLGFLDADGKRFVTGTGDERYIFGFVRNYLAQHCEQDGDLYAPFVNGMAAYYGGYSLSGDDMPTLKRQLRTKLASDPDFNFLAAYQSGRQSSVNRHFTYYVICALICEEVLARFGFDEVMSLARSGRDGDEFFTRLQAVLGVDKAGFHELVVRLIAIPNQ